MSRLYQDYQEKIRPALVKEFGLKNLLAAPGVVKLVINVGLKEAAQKKELIDQVSQEIALITGQKPIPTKAKKSIAGFKLVKGTVIGLKVTLRGKRMYDFLDKLFNLVLPQVKDFKGLNSKSFDGQGNYTLGLEEQLVFPELDYGQIKEIRGLEMTLVTNAKTDEKARKLLELMGAPFMKE
jgi:large subunit ribosomal protein L5